jgi:pyrimidine operon attenuation protein / uracil phosphoribosyltransferase
MNQPIRTLLSAVEMDVILHRLCCQLIENHGDFSNTALVGLQPRGIVFAKRIASMLHSDYKTSPVRLGLLDITFFRDDFRRRDTPLQPNRTKIDFIVEDQKVVFLDDVLYTGRSIRSAMDAILSFGRPREVELMALIDRRFSRHLPIQADYIGRRIDSIDSERVVVEWKEENGIDQVLLTRTQK